MANTRRDHPAATSVGQALKWLADNSPGTWRNAPAAPVLRATGTHPLIKTHRSVSTDLFDIWFSTHVRIPSHASVEQMEPFVVQSKYNAGGAIQGNELGTRRRAFSVDEFCEAHRISRSTFYKLRQVGKGPRTMTVLSRTLISAEAAAEWRAKMEA